MPALVICEGHLAKSGNQGAGERASERASWRFPKFPLHIEIMCRRPANATTAAVALIYGKARKPFLDGDRMDGRATQKGRRRPSFDRIIAESFLPSFPPSPSLIPPTIDSLDGMLDRNANKCGEEQLEKDASFCCPEEEGDENSHR